MSRRPATSGGRTLTRAVRFAATLLDPRPYLQLFRLVHYFNYTHVAERRKVTMGRGVRFAPNVSLANGERITIGDGAHISSRCHIWAGDNTGRITIGEHTLLAPDVFLTASDYRFDLGERVWDQPSRERDIVVGSNAWLGARVIVVAGVEIGDGCIVGAGAVVTQSIPPWSIAVGVPAKVVGERKIAGRDPEPASPAKGGDNAAGSG